MRKPEYITVGQLRAMLDEYPDDDLVIVPCDEDATAFAPICEVTSGHYISDSGMSGDFVEDDEIDDDVNLETARTAIVLWPDV